jgi:hypothetical protein
LLYRAKWTIALSTLGRCDDAFEEWTETEDLLKECSCGGRATRSAVSAAKSAVRNCRPSTHRPPASSQTRVSASESDRHANANRTIAPPKGRGASVGQSCADLLTHKYA